MDVVEHLMGVGCINAHHLNYPMGVGCPEEPKYVQIHLMGVVVHLMGVGCKITPP